MYCYFCNMESMAEIINNLPERALQERKAVKAFFQRLARKPPRDLDERASSLHQEAFEHIDCLECANCCKTTSPIFRDKDIERIAKHLGMRPAQFVAANLYLDDDQDYVLNEAPCLFLNSDNYCSIYEVRPKACREYPHTDRKNFHQILSLTQRNMAICPAVFRIVEQLRQQS